MSDNKGDNKNVNNNNGNNNQVQPPNAKRLFFFMLILSAVLVFLWFYKGVDDRESITYNEFLDHIQTGRLFTDKENPLIIYDTGKISGKIRDREGEKKFQTTIPPIFDKGELYSLLTESDYKHTFKGGSEQNPMLSMLLLNILPIGLLFFLIWFMFRQMQGGGNKAFSFGKSKARKFEAKDKVTFADVAGVEEAKEELQEVVEFLKDPSKFTRIGAKIPKGVLLVGPPGTGKTLLSRAVAGEAGVSFFYMSGSDFVEMFVGVGASRVRDLFEQGKKSAPCILFIDELDAVGRTRGAGYGGGHDEREQTLNQLLVEMDGFDPTLGVILIAATNRADVLDPALLRPGRFDRQVVVDNPDVKGREEILNIHMKKVTLSKKIDVQKIARATPGFSGADLANLVNEAALLAARFNRSKVSMADFEEARDKVMMGVARKSRVITPKDKKITSYHESGHALLTILSEHADALHKVSVIPRGMAAGVTFSLPDEDNHLSKNKLLDQITILLGGRAAEEIILGDICTGAVNDINVATDLARKMVTQWGMSSEMGPIAYGQKDEPIFLGKEIATHKDYSDRTAELIDSEIKSIIFNQYENAKKLLKEHKDKLILLSETLYEKETIDAEYIYELLNMKPLKERPEYVLKDDGAEEDDSEVEPNDGNVNGNTVNEVS